MVSLPPNQEAMKVFSLDDQLDPHFESPPIKSGNPLAKTEELKMSRLQMLKKKFSDASSLIKTKVFFFSFAKSAFCKEIYFKKS